MTARDDALNALRRLAPPDHKGDIKRFLAEDVGAGDITSAALIPDGSTTARVTAKSPCTVAGSEEAVQVFNECGVTAHTAVSDGDAVAVGTCIMTLDGQTRAILTAERLALNFLMRMSGIATETHAIVTACEKINPDIRIAGTRKTTPGFRYYEKKAIILGGGTPHRWGLADAVLIKDNHIAAVGSIAGAVERAQAAHPDRVVEVEVESLDGALEACAAGADIIMLDNFSVDAATEAYYAVKARTPGTLIEISGGMTHETAPRYAHCADIISIGALTHSPRAADFSLKL